MTTAPPPLIGALLRITHEAVRQQVLADVRAAGFELSSAEFAVMQYPGPDGLRPIDLAKQCNVSKQGVNYLLAGLMERGYIERRPSPGRKANAIYLTSRGRALAQAMRASIASLERRWSRQVGAKRYDELRATLYQIAASFSELARPAPAGTS